MKITFISHDASRTGAPILLLNLADALATDQRYEIDFILKRGSGGIIDDFRSRGAVTVATPVRGRLSRLPGIRRLVPSNGYSSMALKKALQGKDIVLSNTITNGDLLPEIRRYFNGPVFSYIHELEMASAQFTNKENIRRLIEASDHFLTPCNAVKRYLVDRLGIPENKIGILPYFIPLSATPDTSGNPTERKGRFVIGGAGTTDWRKGVELFVVVAQQVLERMPQADIRFVWKGAIANSLELLRLQYDIRKAGLEEKIVFWPASAEMDVFFRDIDVFLLTSREDPYPLVVLEAAGHGKPTIGFDGAGGAPEFIEKDAGVCVPYMDVNTMADCLIHYYTNRDELLEKGENARKKVRLRHQQPESIVASFEKFISGMPGTV